MKKGKEGERTINPNIRIITTNIERESVETITDIISKNGVYPSRSEFARVCIHDFLIDLFNSIKKQMVEFGLKKEEEIQTFDDLVKSDVIEQIVKKEKIIERIKENENKKRTVQVPYGDDIKVFKIVEKKECISILKEIDVNGREE